MRLHGLTVRDFRCIESAEVTFDDGLNVLYGPNDLGKSSLVEAIRAALLLQHTSRLGSEYKPWGTDRVPQVQLHLTDDSGRHWRVRKAFSTGRRGSATLEWSNDGKTWTLEDKNRGVDGKLRELLAWGMPDAGAKGGRGAPSSFLATILVGPQMQPGAVFNTSLADDKAESGRERLGEALQALAEDPMFKEVLDHAQNLVDRAFTKQHGRKRTGKDSPFAPVQERIKDLAAKLRELDQQVISSENVRDQLLAFRHNLDSAMNARDEANETLAAIETTWKVEQSRNQARVQLEAAQRELSALEAQHSAIEQLRDHQHELSTQLPTALAVATQADESLSAAQRAVEAAQRNIEQIEQGGDAAGKLHKQSLHTRRLEHRSERDKLYQRLQQAEATLVQQQALEELQEQLTRAQQDLAAAVSDAEAAQRRQRIAEAQRRTLDGALTLRRLQDAEARLAQAQAAAESAATLRGEAAQQLKDADAIEARVNAMELPNVTELVALRQRAQALQLAEARLGGGLSLTVRSMPEGSTIRATADDDAATTLTAGTALEAGRRIIIEVADGIVLEIAAGEQEARSNATTLRAQWTEHAAPILARLGVADVDELETRRRDADAQLLQATQLRASASAAEQRASTHDAIATDEPTRRAAVQRRLEAIAGLDRSQLERDAGQDDEPTLLDKKNAAEAAMEEQSRTATLREKQVAELTADTEALRRRAEEGRSTLNKTLATLAGAPEELVDRLRDQHAAIEGKLEQVEDEYANVEREAAGRLQRAQAEHSNANRALDDVRAQQAAAAKRLEGIKTDVAQVVGQLREKEALADKVDATAVRALVVERRAALERLPPATEGLEQKLDESRKTATQAAAHVRELDKSLASQQGELKQVGGNVVLQDRHETEHALQAARADETEIELDYEAYKLLVDVMRQTESDEGHHLGKALQRTLCG
ncbi:MAG: AAA family ATPase, partial [Nannocystaceae bacterium]|nr:AAA family ATPase [Nannocystaceae bacterium]